MKEKTKVPFTKPYRFDYPAVEKKISKILRSPHWSKGKYVEEFENAFARFLGVKHAVAVSSCTSGLSLALASLKRKSGEVIVPGFSFPAVANAVALNGLKPLFVDVDSNYGNIDFMEVEKAVSSKTAAILPVSNYGFPPDLDKLETIAKKNKIPLIIDSAQALGASFNGKKCGGFGSAEVFSLSQSKIITTAEGGVVTTNNRQLAEFLRKGRNYGKGEKELFHFTGMSCRLSEFHSVLGIEMLKNIKKILKSRSSIAKKYYEELQDCSGVKIPFVNKKIKPSYNFLVIYINSGTGKSGIARDKVLKKLQGCGVDARKYFSPPIYKHPAFRKFTTAGFRLENCERLASQCLTLPLYPDMAYKDVEMACNVIKKHI